MRMRGHGGGSRSAQNTANSDGGHRNRKMGEVVIKWSGDSDLTYRYLTSDKIQKQKKKCTSFTKFGLYSRFFSVTLWL